jgi:hypothetical protein
MTVSELCRELESRQTELVAFVGTIRDEIFFKGSDERWSPAHHLAHLTFTHKRVTRGFKAKDQLQDYSGEPRSYETMKSKYLTALQSAASAGFLKNNPFAAKVKSDTKETIIADFSWAAQGLREAVNGWTETELDTKGIQHPLLGLLSAREMLLFMIYHDQHHLLGIQKLVEV